MITAHGGRAECCSTGLYTKLTLIVNFKWNNVKMNVIAKISRYFERSVVTLKLRKDQSYSG